MDNQNKKICMKCGVPITPGSAFCTACGAPVPADERKICMKCGVPIAPGSAFCTACGAPAPGSANAAPQAQLSPEEMNKRSYENALKLVEAKQFEQALQLFTRLGDYEDSKKRAEECKAAAEEAKKEAAYASAVALLTAKNVTDVQLKQAIANLKGMSDYKDSKDQAAKLEKCLDQLNKAKAKKKSKMKKIIILAAVALLLIVAAVVTVVVLNIPYKLTVDYGFYGVSETTEYNMLSDEVVLPNLEGQMPGYTFVGWTGTGLEEPQKEVVIGKFSSGNREYKANWEIKKYTITLDADGGSSDTTSISVVYGASFRLPTPTKTGYNFLGWYNGDSQVTSGYWTTDSNVTLKAKWEAKEYYLTLNNTSAQLKITWDYNYSGSTPLINTYSNGDTVSYWIVASRTGYVNTGWYTDAECTTKFNFDSEITSDITLYAGWVEMPQIGYSTYQINPVDYSNSKSYLEMYPNSTNKYYVYFVANETGTHKIYYVSGYYYDGYYLTIKNITTGTTVIADTYVDNTSYSYYSVDCTAGDVICIGVYCDYYDYAQANFYFEGFVVNTDGSKISSSQVSYHEWKSSSVTYKYGDEFTLPTLTKKGSTFLGWFDANDNKVESGVWNFDDDITLTPKFEAGKNTITLDVDGGTVDSETLTVYYGKEYTLPTPTKTGHKFLGWYDADDNKVTSGYWYGEIDTTLKAKWEVKSYTLTLDDAIATLTVTWNYNYGSNYTTDTLYSGSTLSYKTLTRTGYIFMGWYTDAECTTKYGFTGQITEDLTLYAKWEAIPATSYYTAYQIYPSQYNSSSNVCSAYVSSSTYSTYPTYIYLVANETGKHSIYYSNYYYYSYDSYYLTIKNLTSDTTIADTVKVKDSSYSYYSFECNEGDIIAISVYDNSSSTYAYFYFDGFSAITSDAVAAPANLTYNSSKYTSITYNYGDKFTLPTVTREGYTFHGWKDSNGNVVESGTWNYESNLTLVPDLRPVTNTITLDTDGGTVSSTTVSVTYDKSYTLETPTKTGYTFNGWYNADGERVYSGTWKGTADITLKASWSANKYYVTLDDTAENSYLTVTYDGYYSDGSNADSYLSYGYQPGNYTPYTRSGYIFTGWYTDDKCTTKYDFTGVITEDMTLYSGWTAMTSNSYYSRNQITDPTSYTSSNKYSTYTYASSSNSKNYFYLVANEAGTHKIYYSSSSASYPYYMQVTNYTTGTSIMGNKEVSSTAFDYVSFDCAAGDIIEIAIYDSNANYYDYACAYLYFEGFTSIETSAYAVPGCIYDASESLTDHIYYGDEYQLPTLTRDGYTFKGWSTDGTNVDVDMSGTWSISSDVTLYPIWE